jgi:UDP-glucose 4-epimerase
VRILVTGGAGFLGAAFAGHARRAGHAVVTADLTAGEADRALDIADAAAVAALTRDVAPECVVHLAAVLTDAAAVDAVAATRVNALGTASVFASAAMSGARRVVYASSVAAVGPCPEGSGDDVALAPRSVYGATKAFGEHLARAMADEPHGPDFTVLRFGWVYGPGRVRGWRVAQEMIERFAAGEPRVSYPGFEGEMDWTYVADAAEVLLRAATRPLPRFCAFNVMGDRRPISDAAAWLEARCPGSRAAPVPARTPPSGWGLGNDGLAEALGFVPRTTLEQGIDAMLEGLRGPDWP